MDWILLPKGLLLGVSIAAPVGPIGLLAIRRTIADGFRMGIATGLGAATADATYGAIAALGLTAIMSILVEYANTIRLFGGIMLLVIGLRGVWHSRLSTAGATGQPSRPMTAAGSYVQTVGLTMTNPMTIIAFIGMFAGVGISTGGADIPSALALVIGVGLGSAAWWLFLALSVSRMCHRLSPAVVRLINLASSLIIVGFGVAALRAAR